MTGTGLEGWSGGMKTTPDASDRLCCAFDWSALERLDFCPGGIEEQVDLFADSGRLELLQGNDFVLAIG